MSFFSPLSSPNCTSTASICNINVQLSQFSPLTLLLAIPVAQMTVKAFGAVYEQGVNKTVSNLLGRAAFSFSAVRKKYDQKLTHQFEEFQKSALKKWEAFGPAIINLPEKGMSCKELYELIARYKSVTDKNIGTSQLSGAIYSSSLNPKDKPVLRPDMFEKISFPENSPERDAAELKQLFLLAFQDSYLWNALHGSEFAAGQFINYQLVQIIGSQFGGKSDEIAGFITSGGTESLMTAAKAYVRWGVRERGLSQEDCVIVAPRSFHAALKKAQIDYRFKLIELPTDENGYISPADIEKVAEKYGNKIVALFGSAPSYPKGKIDPIAAMSKIAHQLGCGMHVDCCLGGLVVDMIDEENSRYLRLPGVTSLSVDPHKNGMAPKGSSVLVTQQMPTGKNLAFYPIYSIPGWSGGIYGTPTTAGSQSSVAAFTALLALLKMGKNGYRRMANTIHTKAVELGEVIRNCKGLKLLGKVDVNVVAFKIHEEMNYEKGAIYGFTHLMQKHGFTCSNIADDAAHFCVTGRFAGEENVIEKFEKAAVESMKELAILNSLKQTKGIEFPGEASLYGEIGAALHPMQKEMKTSKLLENLLFGELGAEDAVCSYFLATSNPYLKT